MRRIIAFFLLIVSSTLFQQQYLFAKERNVIEFATLYMNRIDRYSYWENNVILDYSPEDMTAEVISNDENGQLAIRCMGGTASVLQENLNIVKFEMLPYPITEGVTGDLYSEWEAKNIISVSALEFDASENKEIIREGTYEGAVTKTTDIWKNQVNLSDALDDAKAGTDVLLLAGDNYDYSLHYESNSETVWIIASATAEVPSEENVESSNEHPGDVPDDAPTGILPDLDKCSAGELEGICSDIAELLEVSEVEKFTVPAGTWIVGKNISSGVYSIKSTGKSSSVYCSIKSSRWGDSAILISSETASGSLRHIPLIDGDEIEISYKEVVFSREASYPEFQTAEKTGKSYDLSDYPQKELQNVYQTAIQKLSGQTFSDIVLSRGIWIVGKDIPSGRYDIKAYVKEGHGNYSFQVYNNEKNSSESGLSQISMFGYGNDVSTNASNIELKEGAVVVADGCMLKLSHADENVFFG